MEQENRVKPAAKLPARRRPDGEKRATRTRTNEKQGRQAKNNINSKTERVKKQPKSGVKNSDATRENKRENQRAARAKPLKSYFWAA